MPEQLPFLCLYNRAICLFWFIYVFVWDTTACIVKTLDFALWFVCCGLTVCFQKRKWPNCKRTFVFRFSCLFHFQVNIWFEPLNEKTTTRNTCVTVICLCNLIGLDEWRQWLAGLRGGRGEVLRYSKLWKLFDRHRLLDLLKEGSSSDF